MEKPDCNCIQKEIDRLKQEKETDWVHHDWGNIEFRYRPWLLSGERLANTVRYTYIYFKFCPMCGIKYKKET